jgi:TonB family protein
VKLLLAKGVDINAKDNQGSTPLCLAVNNGNKDMVELLLSNKADTNAKNTQGNTPLQLAMNRGFIGIVKLLIAKVDVNAKNGKGETLLHAVSRQGHKDVAEMLLAEGADINAKDNDGYTPLHLAAEFGHKDIAELLLAKGADVHARNRCDATPLQMVYGHREIAEFLSHNGGNFDTNPDTGNGLKAYEAEKLDALPSRLQMPIPSYTQEAREKGIEGMVVLKGIIRKDGTVDSLKVCRGLGYGLDESALNTIASKWRFKPGTKNDIAVDVNAIITVSFHVF